MAEAYEDDWREVEPRPRDSPILTRIRELVLNSQPSVGRGRAGLYSEGDRAAVDAQIEIGVRNRLFVVSPSGNTLFASKKDLDKALRRANGKVSRDAKKAERRAAKEARRIERPYFYSGVTPKAIDEDSNLSVYAKRAAAIIDDRLHNFPKHHRRNRTIGVRELAERMGSGVGKSTAQRAAQELIDSGYVYRDEDGSGKRGTLYGFTAETITYGKDEKSRRDSNS